MLRSLFPVLRQVNIVCRVTSKIKHITPVSLVLLSTVKCEPEIVEERLPWDDEALGHEFLIRQATTVNVNSATQLLTVTLVAIQDTTNRIKQALTKEMSLVQQAMEWGEGTPPQHWDQLIAVRGSLVDLKANLQILTTYMEYAEKLATVAAEISYLSGNVVASDAICERINSALRVCDVERAAVHNMQVESLELQQRAIITAPEIENQLTGGKDNNVS